MLRDFEELHGQQRVQSFVEHGLAPLERQLGDVRDQHVLVEAAVLIEEDARPQLVRFGALQDAHENLARLLLADAFLERLEETSEHVVVRRDDLEQFRRVLDIEEHGTERFLLRQRLDQTRGEELKEDARDFELREVGAAGELAHVADAVDVLIDRDLRLIQLQRAKVGRRARDFREHEIETRNLLANPRRLIEPPDALHDHARGVEVMHDPLVRQILVRVIKRELPFLPAEERLDDLQDLILHAPPKILRRDRPHLHEDLPVPQLRRHPPLRLLVLLLRDLPVAQQELPQRMLRRVRRREHDLPARPVDVPLEILPREHKLPRLANHRDETEDIRKLDLREIPLQYR